MNINLSNFFQALNIVVQIASPIVAIVSTLVCRRNNIDNNKNVLKLETSKQEFAKEIEQLKREQALQDRRTELVSSFFGAVLAYSGSFKLVYRFKALETAGSALSVCTPEQAVLINKLTDAINELNTSFLNQSEIDQFKNLVSDSMIEFTNSMQMK